MSRRMSQSTKSRSCRKGTVEDGVGLGCNVAVGDRALLALILDDPMSRAWLTGIGDADDARVVGYLNALVWAGFRTWFSTNTVYIVEAVSVNLKCAS
jgi:hypothetical protein